MAELLPALLPELIALATVAVLMALDMARVDARWGRRAFTALTAAAVAVLAWQAMRGFSAEPVPGEVVIDRFGVLARLTLAAGVLALPLAFRGAESCKHWILVASSMLGGFLLVSSAGFTTLFLGIELLSLPAFALVVHRRGDSVAPEAAFKYLVLSSVATAVLLFGVSLAYGATGTLSIANWTAVVADGGVIARASGLLVLAGLFLKAAVFPFHGWAPDAYAGSRLPVAAMMASLVKAAVVLALARIVGRVPLEATLTSAVAVLALASIAFGNLAALRQRRFRRLLAYSSIAHAGYMVFALLDTTGNRGNDLLLYAAIYAAGTLAACAAVARLCPQDAGEEAADALDGLEGALLRQPVAAVVLAVALLSLAGIPPFPGFFAKLAIFRSVVASGYVVPAVLAFVGSFLGLAYYVGIVLRLFRDDRPEAAAPLDRPAA